MATLLERYYGAGAVDGVDRRFHRFVVNAVPRIPFTLVNASPLTVQLAPSAGGAIYDALFNATRSLRLAPYDPLEGHALILHVIAQRFTQFLVTGLAKGDAPW